MSKKISSIGHGYNLCTHDKIEGWTGTRSSNLIIGQQPSIEDDRKYRVERCERCMEILKIELCGPYE